MLKQSKIEWTELTWNPVTGCTRISKGCMNCYAERLAKRLKAMGSSRYVNGFDVTVHEEAVDFPRTLRQPHTIFVNSMSDLFHEALDFTFIARVFATMKDCPQHTFQVLTKRSQRLRELSKQLPWPSNVWMGVTVEDQTVLPRADDLRGVPAKVKFLSLEPLLGPIHNINLTGIDWVIVGGESGPKARVIQQEWVSDIRDQCHAKHVRFFFKQWGGTNKKKTGRVLEGRTWDEYPDTLMAAK